MAYFGVSLSSQPVRGITAVPAPIITGERLGVENGANGTYLLSLIPRARKAEALSVLEARDSSGIPLDMVAKVRDFNAADSRQFAVVRDLSDAVLDRTSFMLFYRTFSSPGIEAKPAEGVPRRIPPVINQKLTLSVAMEVCRRLDDLERIRNLNKLDIITFVMLYELIYVLSDLLMGNGILFKDLPIRKGIDEYILNPLVARNIIKNICYSLDGCHPCGLESLVDLWYALRMMEGIDFKARVQLQDLILENAISFLEKHKIRESTLSLVLSSHDNDNFIKELIRFATYKGKSRLTIALENIRRDSG